MRQALCLATNLAIFFVDFNVEPRYRRAQILFAYAAIDDRRAVQVGVQDRSYGLRGISGRDRSETLDADDVGRGQIRLSGRGAAARTRRTRIRPSDRPWAQALPNESVRNPAEVKAMPQSKWSDKRERQYEHIKESAESRGKSEKVAERIAASTVNKDRARHGESDTASPSSLRGPSPEHRGGKHSHSGEAGRTRDQLYREARSRGIKGRSRMSKAELQSAVGA